MKTAIILHGRPDAHEYYEMDFPSPSNAHWIPWLQQKFLRAGILCQALEMPTPYEPKYEEWRDTFSQLHINPDTIIVAHSAGCGFVLKYLHEFTDITFNKFIMVAPWRDPYKEQDGFLTCDLNKNLLSRINQTHLLYSRDEPIASVTKSVKEIMITYPKINAHYFDNKGHFCLDSIGSEEFPELWEICSKP